MISMETKKTKFKTKRSIRFKIMLMTNIIVIAVMIVCSLILRYSMNSLTKSILIDVLQPMAKQSSKAVESNIHLMADRIMGIATDSRLMLGGSNYVNVQEVLADAINTYELYGIGIYGMDGRCRGAKGDIYENLSETSWFNVLKESDNMTIADPVITDSYIGIPMAMPVKYNGRTNLYLAGIYKYDLLREVLASIHIGHNGKALIINNKGKIVGHLQEELVRKETNIYDLDSGKEARSIFDSMAARETGSAEGVVNGEDSYVSYCPVRGLRGLLSKLPFGLDTPVYKDFDNRGVDISGGEAQKVAIARALYHDTPFVILDEPTAVLDPLAEYEIYSRFDELVGTKTAVYISHRLSSCQFCNDILVIDKGKAVQRGNHNELIKEKDGLYYKLWNTQAKYYKVEGENI